MLIVHLLIADAVSVRVRDLFVCLVVVIGGVDMMTQALQLAKKPHIVIGNYSS